MAFSEDIVKQAWDRAGGKCECTRSTHCSSRCEGTLTWHNRGKGGSGAWEAHHKTFSGGDELANCEILCWDCHRMAISI